MKKAIITGASSGLGAAIAKKLDKQKVSIVNISTSSTTYTDIICDLKNKSQREETIKQIRADHSDCDVLILNAGVMPREAVGKIQTNSSEVFEINTISNIHFINQLLDILIHNHADIILVGSTAAYKHPNNSLVYTASKSAMKSMAKTLQKELADKPVRVIGFHPGGFNSNLRGGVQKDRYMNPSDLADIIYNLLLIPKSIEVSEIVINRKSQ